jgi:hypothetical protein
VALRWDVRCVDQDRWPLRDDEELGGAGARRQRRAGHRGEDARAHQGGVPRPLLRRLLPGSSRSRLDLLRSGEMDVSFHGFSSLMFRSLRESWPWR